MAQTMNEWLRSQLGRLPTEPEPQSEPAPVGVGSADGAAGAGFRPRPSASQRMNKAIRDTWMAKRRGSLG